MRCSSTSSTRSRRALGWCSPPTGSRRRCVTQAIERVAVGHRRDLPAGRRRCTARSAGMPPRDHTVLLIGHADHEEVVGTVGEAPGRVRVVADEAEARRGRGRGPGAGRLRHADDAGRRRRRPDRRTCCGRVSRSCARPARTTSATPRATGSRRCATSPATVDLVLVVGSPNSSNSLRLVEVARRAGVPAYLVDDVADVDLAMAARRATDRHHRRRVGAAPSRRRPRRRALRPRHRSTVHEHRAVEEDVRFALPKEVS